MNTQGWIRGMMSKNMSNADFFQHVALCINKEFEEKISIVMTECLYGISIGKFKIFMPKDKVKELQLKSPYSLDRYIFDKLFEQGFELDKYRSQYIRYCYGLFYYRADGTVY